MTTSLLYADGVWDFLPHPRIADYEFLPSGPDAGMDYLESADGVGTLMNFGRSVEIDVGLIALTFPYIGPLVFDPTSSVYARASWTYRSDGAAQSLGLTFIDTRDYVGAEEFPEDDPGALLQNRIDNIDGVEYTLCQGYTGNGNSRMQTAYDDGFLAVVILPAAPIGEGICHLSYFVVLIDNAQLLGIAPPLRVFPRDDALTGGATRTYPPSKAQQRGIRRGPGSYL